MNRPFGRGTTNNPILRGLTLLTMVINQLRPSWGPILQASHGIFLGDTLLDLPPIQDASWQIKVSRDLNRETCFQPSDYVGSTPKTQDAITCGILVVGIFPKHKGFPNLKMSCHPGGDVFFILGGQI